MRLRPAAAFSGIFIAVLFVHGHVSLAVDKLNTAYIFRNVGGTWTVLSSQAVGGTSGL